MPATGLTASKRSTLFLAFTLLSACDCSSSHVVGSDADTPDVQTDAFSQDTPDVPPVCRFEPEPRCATAPNATVQLTLGVFDSPTLDLSFGYLSYNRGFDYSMSLRFMENGEADLCSDIQLHGRIQPPDGLVMAGTHQVSWLLSIQSAGFSHSFMGEVELTSANEGELFAGPVSGSIVDVEMDDIVVRFDGAFEMSECEPWATRGS